MLYKYEYVKNEYVVSCTKKNVPIIIIAIIHILLILLKTCL